MQENTYKFNELFSNINIDCFYLYFRFAAFLLIFFIVLREQEKKHVNRDTRIGEKHSFRVLGNEVKQEISVAGTK